MEKRLVNDQESILVRVQELICSPRSSTGLERWFSAPEVAGSSPVEGGSVSVVVSTQVCGTWDPGSIPGLIIFAGIAQVGE